MHLLQSWHIRFGHLHLPPGSLRNRSPTLPLSNSNSCTQRDRLHDGYSDLQRLHVQDSYRTNAPTFASSHPITARIRSSHAGGAASLEAVQRRCDALFVCRGFGFSQSCGLEAGSPEGPSWGNHCIKPHFRLYSKDWVPSNNIWIYLVHPDTVCLMQKNETSPVEVRKIRSGNRKFGRRKFGQRTPHICGSAAACLGQAAQLAVCMECWRVALLAHPQQSNVFWKSVGDSETATTYMWQPNMIPADKQTLRKKMEKSNLLSWSAVQKRIL